MRICREWLEPRPESGLDWLKCADSGLDYLICGLDCLICGLDCLKCGLDSLICGLDFLIHGLGYLIYSGPQTLEPWTGADLAEDGRVGPYISTMPRDL